MRHAPRRIAAPRLLPATIVAIAALLGMKTVALVRAATPASTAAAAAPGGRTVGATIGAPTAVPAAPPGGGVTGGTGGPPPPATSPAERALLGDLAARRKQLDARAAALTARESVLAAAERRLDQRVAELKALEGKLQALEATRQHRKDAAWDGLVSLYQSMKPRQAAKIFDQLKMSVLLAVVDRMDARRAAAIMAAMQPDRAREVTDRLAALRLHRDDPATGAPPPAAPTPQGRS